MKALLLKDWYILVKQARWSFMLIFVFIFVSIVGKGTVFYALIATMVCSMLPVSTMAYDQMSRWDVYVLALPFSKKDIVYSKYLLVLISIALSLVLMILLNGIVAVLPIKAMTMNQMGQVLCLQAILGLLFSAINYPIIFKLGVEKGRALYMIINFFLMAIVGALLSLKGGDFKNISYGTSIPFAQLLYFLLGALCIWLLSVFISFRFSNKREL